MSRIRRPPDRVAVLGVDDVVRTPGLKCVRASGLAKGSEVGRPTQVAGRSQRGENQRTADPDDGDLSPAHFITGFFGMNFGWMVDHIGTAAAFVVFGIVVPVVLVVIILVAVRWLATD
jgi:hypothetical protein